MGTHLRTLRQRMTNSQFRHIIPLLPQTNKIIINPRLILPCIIEIELLRLHIIFPQFLLLEFRYLFQETLFFFERHAPDYHDAVFEEEDFGDVDCGVEVGQHDALVDAGGVFGDDFADGADAFCEACFEGCFAGGGEDFGFGC